jgi:hypothetical protein
LAVKAYEEAGEDERTLLDMGEDELRAEIDRLAGVGKALKAKTFDPRPVQVTTFKC